MYTLLNLVRMTVSGTPGTGTITLGSAVTGCLTVAQSASQAGASIDGKKVRYSILDGDNTEVGIGTYTASGTTLSRDRVLASTNSGSKINASPSSEVLIMAVAEDFGSAAALAKEILADTPTGYWKCDDSGSTLADSSGNGFTLTLGGTTQVNHSPLLANDTTKYLRIGGTTAGGSATSALGTSPPLTGDWTIEAIIRPETVSANTGIFTLGLHSSETEANNTQLAFVLVSATIDVLWESGAGTDRLTVSPYATAILGVPQHYVAVKDGTANTVTFYRNGHQIGQPVSYGTEPTGGTGSIEARIGYDGITSQNNCVLGHVAFYNGAKLSADRIYAHARAAGFTGG